LEESTQNNRIIVEKTTNGKLILGIIIAVGVACFFAGYVFATETAEPEQIIIQDSSQVLRNTEQLSQGPSQPSKIFVSLDDDPIKGNPEAELTIVEFSDFQCPFCAKFHSETLPLLTENYINTGKVNFVYRDFPIQSIHPNAIPAALSAECADDQGKFWQMHDMIFENQKSWQDQEISQSVTTFKEYAVMLGLNSKEFDFCLDSGKYMQEIQNDLNDGRAYGVTGTPGFFVGNEKIGFVKVIGAQPYSVFQRILGN